MLRVLGRGIIRKKFLFRCFSVDGYDKEHDYIRDVGNMESLNNEETNDLASCMNTMTRILDHKYSGKLTEHDILPKEILQDDPRIAYVFPKKEDNNLDYQGKRILSIAICGAPNAGKSTLLNSILGEKISAVSNKPNTTRCSIVGCKNVGETQLLFYDTPGIIQKINARKEEVELARMAEKSVKGMDAILTLIDASLPMIPMTQQLIERMSEISFASSSLLYIALNKVDLITPKSRLLTLSNEVSNIIWKKKLQLLREAPQTSLEQKAWENEKLFMISGLDHDGVDDIIGELCNRAKPGEWYVEQEERGEQYIERVVTEVIKEKLFKYCSREIPYDMYFNTLEMKKDGERKVFHQTIVIPKIEDRESILKVKRKLEKTSSFEIADRFDEKVTIHITII